MNELKGTWREFKSSITDEKTINLLEKIDEKAEENLNNASKHSTVKIMKKNKLYILCGITGSGKTTKAKKISNVVFEADNYWLNCVGDYLFIPTKLGAAHKWCQDQVRQAMVDGKSLISVANTNLTPKERKPYINLAKEYNYDVELVLPDSPWFLDILPRLRNKTFTDDDVWTFVRKNTHGVPFDSVKKMMERWDETFAIE